MQTACSKCEQVESRELTSVGALCVQEAQQLPALPRQQLKQWRVAAAAMSSASRLRCRWKRCGACTCCNLLSNVLLAAFGWGTVWLAGRQPALSALLKHWLRFAMSLQDEWNEAGEEDSGEGDQQQQEGQDVAAASPQQASASAATNGRAFRRGYRYLRASWGLQAGGSWHRKGSRLHARLWWISFTLGQAACLPTCLLHVAGLAAACCCLQRNAR